MTTLKKIVCKVRVDEAAKLLEFTWSEGSAAFKPYILAGKPVELFRRNAKVAREKLLRLVEIHRDPPDRRDTAQLAEAGLDLSQAGFDLYNLVFFAAREEDRDEAEKVAEWLQANTETNRVESLEIVTVGRPWFAPWNLIYDAEPDEDAFQSSENLSAYAPFWGLRYNLCGGQPVNPLRRNPLPPEPVVLLVMDPVVVEDLGGYVGPDGQTQRARLDAFLAAHPNVKMVNSPAALGKALRDKRPHLIYWMGHAEPDALYLGSGPDDRVDQDALQNMLLRVKRGSGQGGLVILNGCQTAQSGDLGSFLETFHDAEYSGLIATEEQTLDTFANPFGLTMLERFLDRGEPIGKVLHDLRRDHVPLGLLYGTYCPPDLHLQLAGDDGNLSALRRAEILGGAMLRGRPAPAPQPFGPAIDPAPQLAPLPDAPYRPLDAFGPEDRALFTGRESDIHRCAVLLDRPATRVLLVHGPSGVGKSSFLQAGLIPEIERDVFGYQVLRDRRPDVADPRLFIRSTGDPLFQLAQAICDFASRPLTYASPNGGEVEVDLPGQLGEATGLDRPIHPATLREAMLADTDLFGRVLDALSSDLPGTLILFLDQAEEMFTLARTDDELAARDQLIDMLRRVSAVQGGFKVVISLRTEFVGRLACSLREGHPAGDGLRDYLLGDLGVPDLERAILSPTLRQAPAGTAEIPFVKYGGFRFADGVAGQIARTLVREGRNDGVLPLLQIVCSQLYARVADRPVREVTEAELQALGGFDGAVRRHAEREVAALAGEESSSFDASSGGWWAMARESVRPRSETRKIQAMMTRLKHVQVDGTVTTDMVREDELARHWDGRLPFEKLIARGLRRRLFRVTTRRQESGREERLISLGHDALARVADAWSYELAAAERLRKLAGRLAAMGLLLLVFAALSVASVGFAIEASRQRKEVLTINERAMDLSQRSLDLIDDLLTRTAEEDLRALPMADQLRRRLLARASEGFQSFLTPVRNDPVSMWGACRAYLGLADAHLQLGEFEDASVRYTGAVALLNELVGLIPENERHRHARGRIANGRGLVAKGLGELEEAERLLKQAVDIRMQLNFDTPARTRDLAESLYNRGTVVARLPNRLLEAVSLYNTALGALTMAGNAPDVLALQARILNNRGIAYQVAGLHDKAEVSLRAVLELRTAGQTSGVAGLLRGWQVARARTNLANLLIAKASTDRPSGYKEALDLLREAREQLAQLRDSYPDVPDFRRELGEVDHSRANVLAAQGKSVEALEALEEALRGFDSLMESGVAQVEDRRQQILIRLERDLLGRPADAGPEAALTFLQAAVDAMSVVDRPQLPIPGPPDLKLLGLDDRGGAAITISNPETLKHLGQLELRISDTLDEMVPPGPALEHAERAIVHLRAAYVRLPEHRVIADSLAQALGKRGFLLLDKGEYERAADDADESVTLSPTDPATTRDAFSTLAGCYQGTETNRDSVARRAHELLRGALRRETILGADDLDPMDLAIFPEGTFSDVFASPQNPAPAP